MYIFYDVDTQKDFMNADGALYVPKAEEIKKNLALLTQYAKNRKIKVLGSVDRHFGTEEWKPYELELSRWGGPFPDHCMDKTDGQEKIIETFLEKIFIENTSPSQKIKEYSGKDIDKIANSWRSIIFEKQGYSVFPTKDCPGGNKYAELFLKHLGVKKAIVYGVATDYCVKAAVLGLAKQKPKIEVYLVSDAIKAVNVEPEDGKRAIDEMVRAGAKKITTEQVFDGV